MPAASRRHSRPASSPSVERQRSLVVVRRRRNTTAALTDTYQRTCGVGHRRVSCQQLHLRLGTTCSV
ncbi:unnamed protein product [Acanthoscelides obtectus]|uniref:Uncharacterized protein n=1 Tax=Acanthoscelides obtectus TaxID=200917 RepID=A0A9P0KS70_ACAOB|nr:unnamed protein product [Acanthoscelides obtectus]CAK1662967.1 hypothetical protein AOBTE_LOCUS23404 [Acanthoscelides obtectus]